MTEPQYANLGVFRICKVVTVMLLIMVVSGDWGGGLEAEGWECGVKEICGMEIFYS